jgi:hypothetical protein
MTRRAISKLTRRAKVTRLRMVTALSAGGIMEFASKYVCMKCYECRGGKQINQGIHVVKYIKTPGILRYEKLKKIQFQSKSNISNFKSCCYKNKLRIVPMHAHAKLTNKNRPVVA